MNHPAGKPQAPAAPALTSRGNTLWSAKRAGGEPNALVTNEHDGLDTEITSVAIVERTAQLGALPIWIGKGSIEYRGATRRRPRAELDSYRRGIGLRDACVPGGGPAAACARRRAGQPSRQPLGG
jgi:hypothetical protein